MFITDDNTPQRIIRIFYLSRWWTKCSELYWLFQVSCEYFHLRVIKFKWIFFKNIAIAGVFSQDIVQPGCVQTQACIQNFDWDPVSCQCACLRLAKCLAGNFWDLTTCSCKPLPCPTTVCPENYTADPNDKCKCKCNESPVQFCGRGRGWDRTVCQCVSMCDFIKQCPKGQKWSLRSCSCKPICTNICPKNYAADIDQNCQCLCTLPAQTCKVGFAWSKKTCSCV